MFGSLVFVATRLMKNDTAAPDAEIAKPAKERAASDLEAPQLSADAKRPAVAAERAEVGAQSATQTEGDAAKADPAEKLGRPIVARVVDSAKQPAPVIGLKLTCDFGAERTGNALATETDATGVATFYEMQLGQTCGAMLPTATFTLDVDLELDVHLSKKLQFEQLFAAPIEFELPPLAAIAVTVTRGGAIVAEPVAVTLKPAQVFGADAAFRVTPPTRTAIHGEASFIPVALGRKFYVVVDAGGHRVTSVDAYAGPIAPGETTAIRFDLDQVPYYVFRLLDAGGQPIADRDIQALRTLGTPNGITIMLGDRVKTDDLGRGEVRWPEPWEKGAKRRLQLVIGAGAPESSTGSVAVDVSKEPLAGANDLGDLRIEPPKSLASGIVVDPSGNPVAEAKVEARSVAQQNVHDDDPSAPPPQFTAHTDAAGRFEIRGEGKGPFMLVAQKESFAASEAATIEAGQSGLRLVLRGAGSVAASVKLPAFLETRWVKGRLFDAASREAGRRDATPERTKACTDDGALEFHDLLPGAYSFELEAGPLDPAVVVDGIVVVAGETTRDPRLQQISLAAKLVEIDVTVVDGSGRPIEDAIVSAIAPRGMTRGRKAGAGISRVAIDARGQTIAATATGHRPAVREGVRASTRLVLGSALSVRVRAKGDEPLARAPVSLRFSLQATEETAKAYPAGLPLDLGIMEFGPDRTASFEVPFPGTYLFEWMWTKSSADYGMCTSIGDPVEIRLNDAADLQTFDVDVPKNGLDAMGG